MNGSHIATETKRNPEDILMSSLEPIELTRQDERGRRPIPELSCKECRRRKSKVKEGSLVPQMYQFSDSFYKV